MPRADTGIRERLAAMARAAQPLETCGFLLGPPVAPGEPVFVDDLAEALRARVSPAAFRFDPIEQAAIERSARARGRLILGIWHSHPDGVGAPSAQDLAGLTARAAQGWRWPAGEWIVALPSTGGILDAAGGGILDEAESGVSAEARSGVSVEAWSLDAGRSAPHRIPLEFGDPDRPPRG